jgi:hypothetical protein
VCNPITGSPQKEYLHSELEDPGGKGKWKTTKWGA